MAAPTVRAVGTVASSAATPLSVATPGGVVVSGELLVTIFEFQTGADTNHVTLAGWDEVAFVSRAAITGRTGLAVMARISDGTEGSAELFALAGTINHWIGRMIAISGHGLATTADITGGSTITGGAGAGADPQTNTLTAITTDADSMVLIIGGSGRDIASTTEFSAYTNANFASITEQMDNMVTTGTGGGICMASATFAAGGSTGTTTYQQLIRYDWNGVQLGIKPVGVQTVTVAAALGLTLTPVAPQVNWQRVVPALVALTLALPAPVVNQAGIGPQSVSPAALSLTLSRPAPQLNLRALPGSIGLTLGLVVPPDIVELVVITPGSIGLTLSPQATSVAVISFQPAAFQTDAFETTGAQAQTVVPSALGLSLGLPAFVIPTNIGAISLRLILPTSGAWGDVWGTGWGNLSDGMHIDVIGVAPALGLVLSLPAPAVAKVASSSIVLQLGTPFGYGQEWGTNWGAEPQMRVVFNPVVSPAARSLTLTPVAPAVNRTTAVTPASLSLALTPQAFALIGPQTIEPASMDLSLENPDPDEITVGPPTPGALSLTLATPAPNVSQGAATQTVTPAAQGLTLTPVAPQVRPLQFVNPAALGLTLTPVAPVVLRAQLVPPGAIGLTLTLVAPQVFVPQTVTLTAIGLVLTPVTPLVQQAGAAQSVLPAALNLSLTAVAPVVLPAQRILPAAVNLTLAATAPQVRETAQIGALGLTLTPVAPLVRPVQTVQMGALVLGLSPLASTIFSGALPPFTVLSHEGPLAGGAPAGGVLVLAMDGPEVGGSAAGTVLTLVRDGAKAGGSPTGTALKVSQEGAQAGGSPSGNVLVTSRKGP